MANPQDDQIRRLLELGQKCNPAAAGELLPLVYDDLRRLARSKVAMLAPGQTLSPTALVHEAYLRILGDGAPSWEGARHFFFAAARAMHDILVEGARRKAALKHGGGRDRVDVDHVDLAIAAPTTDLLSLHEALTRLDQDDPRKRQIVELRFFAGLTMEETSRVMGIPLRTLEREWRYVRALLHKELVGGDDSVPT